MQILIQKAGPENLDAIHSLYPHLFSSDDINVLHFFKKLNRKKMLEEGRGTERRSMENLQLLVVIA